MTGSILGVLHGDGAIRPAWIRTVHRAHRIDLDPLTALAALTLQLHAEPQAVEAHRLTASNRYNNLFVSILISKER